MALLTTVRFDAGTGEAGDQRSGRRHPSARTMKTSQVLVGAEGFEPPAPCSQSRCSTRLSYAPTRLESMICFACCHPGSTLFRRKLYMVRRG
jgi:hypothetical protein